jgi:succinate-semialdehyde dehydrogenase/glutarate-semialdehyde dehydrogenase
MLRRSYSTGHAVLQTLDAIQNKQLIQTVPYIAGEFGTDSIGSNKQFPVINPFNGSILTNVTSTGESQLLFAINNSADAFERFKHTTPRWRSRLLRKLNDEILANVDDLARIITLENGKPLADSIGEVRYGASFMEWFAEEAPRINGSIISSADPTKRISSYRLPIGPVGILTPWNFPLAMITRKLGAAIAAGCTAVIKPASDTPLTALAFAQICQNVGVPAGVVNIVPVEEMRTPEFGKIFCESPELKKISFTGSTNVGKLLLKQSASTVKKVSMELGGNSPFIVSDKVKDLEKAVDGMIAAKFRSSGQTCVCVNRVYVSDSIYDEFVEILLKKLDKNIKLGSGMDPKVTHGPLIHERALNKVANLTEDALNKGAKLLYGGKQRPDLGSTFYELTVLGDVTPEMEIYETEIFGPIASLIRYNGSMSSVVAMANRNREDVGLAAYVFSDDVKECKIAQEELHVGMVGVNTGLISEAALPFGGVRCSGFGREGSVFGVEEYTVVKSVVEKI